MLLLIFFALPLLAALLCLALDRALPTRWLGVGGALACLGAAGVLLAAGAQGALALPEYVWALLDTRAVRLALRFDGVSQLLALIVTGGGGLALLALALSLPAQLRGFGGLFSALLLMLLATLAGLASNEPLLLPFAWALATLLGFVALRASGIQFAAGLPAALSAGLLGALALLGAALAGGESVAGTPPSALVLGCWALAALLALGAPPFHAAADELAAAPAGLAGALLALGVPLLGGAALLRFVAARVEDGAAFHRVLLALGLLTALVCAAGALGERRLRRLLGWAFSAQLGLLLAALGLPQSALTVAAPALLANALLTTLAAYLAIVLMERRAGTDDLSQMALAEPLPLAGLALLLAAAAAVGLPGTWGFWGRQWLFDGLRATQPWAIAPLLAAHALLALAFVAPLLACWRAAPAERALGAGRTWASGIIQASALLVALPLLAFGLLPEAAWQLFGAAMQATLAPGAAAAPPALPDLAMQVAGGGALLLIVLLPLLLRRTARRAVVDPETPSATMTPDALAESLRWLAWIGAPGALFGGAWTGLQSGSRLIRRALALFEERYYLAGLMLALVVVVLLLL